MLCIFLLIRSSTVFLFVISCFAWRNEKAKPTFQMLRKICSLFTYGELQIFFRTLRYDLTNLVDTLVMSWWTFFGEHSILNCSVLQIWFQCSYYCHCIVRKYESHEAKMWSIRDGFGYRIIQHSTPKTNGYWDVWIFEEMSEGSWPGEDNDWGDKCPQIGEGSSNDRQP